MASNTEDISTNVDTDATTMSSCLNDPNYAIICVFLQKFGALLNIEHPDFSELQQMVENTDEGRCRSTAQFLCSLFGIR